MYRLSGSMHLIHLGALVGGGGADGRVISPHPIPSAGRYSNLIDPDPDPDFTGG